jgi:meso-butanediol dehydrogenase / (S,S)-butanediol dehydrogenase / diacetyl reductase
VTDGPRPLEGKIAMVTGAGQGAGRGVAEAFVEAGARVALLGRTPAKLTAVAAGCPPGATIVVACDLGEPAQIDDAVDRVLAEYGTVDLLVNAAHHTVRHGALLEVSDDDIDLLWRTGPMASLRLMRRCHPHLREGGVIINFGSGAQFTPQNYGVYAATKDALAAITRTAAVEWGPDGIRAHLIVPHVVSPSMDADFARRGGVDDLIARIPLRRLGRPTDVGAAAVFLAGPSASFITGQVLMVDGGLIYHR